jgi:4-hydroxy-tetrahydrodipicolinate synthase
MTTTDKYSGLIVPLLLPLDAGGQIDAESLGRQVDFLVERGVDGLWVNGTSGDFFALSARERSRVVELVAAKRPARIPIIAQCGDNSTPQVIDHAKRALDAGADSVAAVPPYYLEYSQEELKLHYTAVSEAVRMPFFLYQLPQMAKVALDLSSILELAATGVLSGVKDSAANLESYQRLLRRVAETGSPLRCFNGTSSLLGPALLVGGHGLMCAIANLVPDLCKRAYVAAQAARWDEVRELSAQVSELIEALRLPSRIAWAATIAGYKYVLCKLGVIATDRVVPPLKPLTTEERQLLDRKAVSLTRELLAANRPPVSRMETPSM